MRSIAQLMDLHGRCAVITGATGGIGRQIAITVAELGGDLVLVDLPGSDYESLREILEAAGAVNVECLDCDLEDSAARGELIAHLDGQDAAVDILVNNAAFVGTSDLEGWGCEFELQSVATWRRALEVNLTAVFDLSKGLAPKLRSGCGGSIINIASIYGVNGPDYSLYEGLNMGNPAAYAASKGGVLQLTRWLATTMAPDVRVNAISPGGVFRDQPEKFVERYQARTPLGRMATEEDFKGVIAFLASDLSAYVTGQNIVVDGGWTAW
jgi:NAD(P)-dependent dehydrogenase (short-subunit alcohol dehydrogenase family)